MDNDLLFRKRLSARLGLSFNGARDIYESCGYRRYLDYDLLRETFEREDLARTIVSAYPTATWSRPPVVRETEDVNDRTTQFENDWQDLIRRMPIFAILRRADILCGIGHYGAILLGFNDGRALKEPVGKATKLLYARPFAEGSVDIVSYEQNRNSERYGLPLSYRIRFVSRQVGTENAVDIEEEIHWSRVVHIADNKEESDIFGVPRLVPVYNRLFDLQKILSCSAEMFWQGAFQGLAFNLDPEAELNDGAKLEEQIQAYVHGMQRYMKLQGIDAKSLHSPVANPKASVEVQFQVISGVTGIPLRILTGSERGELSSTQDENSWRERVSFNNLNHAEPDILRPFVSRLIYSGVLAKPEVGEDMFHIEWRDTSVITHKQDMETARIMTDALRMYVESGAYNLIKPEQYLEKVFHFRPDQIKKFGIAELVPMDAGGTESGGEVQYQDSKRMDNRPHKYDSVTNKKVCVM